MSSEIAVINIGALVSLIILVAALAVAIVSVGHLRRTTATYNARLLPFAYFSIASWVVWVVIQFIYVIVYHAGSAAQDALALLNILQTACLFMAVLALNFPATGRPIVALPLLVAVSAVAGFIARMFYFSSIYQIVFAIASAAVLWSFVPAILRLSLPKRYAAAFALYGCVQLLWLVRERYSHGGALAYLAVPVLRAALLVAWTRTILRVLSRAESSFDQVTSTLRDLRPSSAPTLELQVMISSTFDDLVAERDAADRAISALHLARFKAESYGSVPRTPRWVCETMAKQCDIFLLIIGERYGCMLPEGISAVEFEYQVARRHNPNKILVYVKNAPKRESRLLGFLQQVQDFDQGYFRSSFNTPEELFERIHVDVARWLVAQAKRDHEEGRKPNSGTQPPSDARG